MQIAYGIKVEDHDDPFLKLAEEAMECGRIIASAGAYLVDLFPIRTHPSCQIVVRP